MLLLRFRSAFLVGCLGLLPATVNAENWPGFRGPTGMGISQETELPLTWNASDGSNLLWKVPLPATSLEAKADHNQSSPIIWQDRVFITTAFWPADRKPEEQPEQRLKLAVRKSCHSLSHSRPAINTRQVNTLRA